MPTSKPRISIVIDAEDLAVIDRYAAASGTPRASMLASMVRATVPELRKAAELIELANAAPRHVLEGLVDNLANATADAMGFLEPFHADYHLILDRLQRELPIDSPVKRGSRSGGAGGASSRRASGASAAPGPAPGGRRRGPQDPHLLTGGSN